MLQDIARMLHGKCLIGSRAMSCHRETKLLPQLNVVAALALIVETIDPCNRSTFLGSTFYAFLTDV